MDAVVVVMRVLLYGGGSGWMAWSRVWKGRVVLCVCVVSLDYLCR